ncbi:MAG: hypothetical protein M0P59_01525 [Gallionella sp.]|jgi:hypothetical protein|nr:hypothetical protein [Gallionella sp.]MCK9352821.1 hypothetical protein [Gallionella sp.]
MYRTFLWIVCLLLVSTGAIAAPRTLIRDGSQIGGIKAPVAGQLKRSDAASMPASGARRLDIQAHQDKLASDDLAAFTVLTQPHGKAALIVSRNTLHTDFVAAPRTDFTAEEIPAHIKLVLAQPAAPPIDHHQTLAPRQAL